MDKKDTWAYQSLDKRDLRLDFMRGLIMLYVVVVHFEFASLFSLLAWERLGIVSSAEGFVLLSGLVLGLVYRNHTQTFGLYQSVKRLWLRAFKLYKVNLFVILTIPLLGLLPLINTFEVTHWWVPALRSQAYHLYPDDTQSLWVWLWQALSLKIGPHQFQIIGLYVILLGLAPTAIIAIIKGQLRWLLLFSWSIYIVNLFFNYRLTPARFELGFPLLSWQLLFFNGLIIGYYKDQVLGWLVDDKNRWVGHVAAILCLAFIALSFSAPNKLFWPWQNFSFIPTATYQEIYGFWFNKTILGPGRLLNNIVLFITMYILLSRYWRAFNNTLGWLLIPLGQSSLYIFFVHVYLLLLVTNLPIPIHDNFWVGTIIHGSIFLLLWIMVKKQFLFNLIPR
jgi:hypothetical protein